MSQMFFPKTIEEAVEMIKVPHRIFVAGATNLYVDRQKGKFQDNDIVSLHQLTALTTIEEDEATWYIGGLTIFETLEQKLMSNPLLMGLAQAASEVGGPQIRHRGTIAGNIISASPAADSVPVLMALDAQLKLVSKDHERITDINGFMVGPGKTNIAKDELLTEIIIPKQPGRTRFRKVGKRNALAISIINVAVYMEVEAQVIKEIRISVGSAGPTALRAINVEKYLKNMKKPQDEAAWAKVYDDIEQQLLNDIHPIDDLRSTASYRQTVASRIIYQLVAELWEDKDEA